MPCENSGSKYVPCVRDCNEVVECRPAKSCDGLRLGSFCRLLSPEQKRTHKSHESPFLRAGASREASAGMEFNLSGDSTLRLHISDSHHERLTLEMRFFDLQGDADHSND